MDATAITAAQPVISTAAILGSVTIVGGMASTTFLIGKMMNGRRNGKKGCPERPPSQHCQKVTDVERSIAVIDEKIDGLRRENKLQFKTVFRLLGQKPDEPGSADTS